MKKAYIAPQSEIVALGIQAPLALSYSKNEEIVPQWSQHRGGAWSSESWTQAEEE